jgi:hypothetical protein
MAGTGFSAFESMQSIIRRRGRLTRAPAEHCPQATLRSSVFVEPLVEGVVFSERVPLQVDDQLVHGRLAQGMEVDGQSEFAQRAANALVLGPKFLDLVSMRGSDEREQALFFRIEVVTEISLEPSPLFRQCRWIGSFDRIRQLRQEFLE